VAVQRKNVPSAEQDLSKAMEVAPRSPLPYLRFGQLRLEQKRWDDAEHLLSQSLELDPKSVDAMRALVMVDIARKQPAKAIARLNTQITKIPNVSGFYDLLAAVQAGQGDYSSAEGTLEKGLQLNSQDPGAVQLFTQVELKLGKADKAIHAWEQWINSHPNDAQAYAVLGSLEETQDRTKAQTYYQKALQLNPDQPVAANNLAFLMLETGQNVDMALTLAQTARRLTPNAPNTADTLAWAYYYKGSYSMARDLLENALKVNPNNALYHYHLGMICLKLSDQNNASIHLKRALTLAPNTQTAENAKKALGTIS
jgi:tetratricopeptide (TPR) repeat protein